MFWVLRHQQGLSGQYLRRHTCIFSLHRGQQPKDAMSPASGEQLQHYAALRSTSPSPLVPKYRAGCLHLICSAQEYSHRMGSFQCSTHGILRRWRFVAPSLQRSSPHPQAASPACFCPQNTQNSHTKASRAEHEACQHLAFKSRAAGLFQERYSLARHQL